MLSLDDKDKLPKTAGIYRVIDSEKNVLYVGQAVNIHNRWNKKRHFKLDEIEDYCEKNTTSAFIDWVLIADKMLNRVENCAVRFYQPILNKVTPPVV